MATWQKLISFVPCSKGVLPDTIRNESSMPIIRKKVRLYPNGNLAICAKKDAASLGGSAALGIDFTTPQGLISDAWLLFGDGRKIVSDMDRILLVDSLISRFDFDSKIGTAKVISRFLQDGLYAFLQAGREACETDAERSLFDLALSYDEALAKRDLVEGCQAAPMLASRVKASYDISLGEPCALSGYLRAFYCDDLGLDMPSFDHGLSAGPEDLAILMPAGRTMIDKMAFDEVLGSCHRSIAVCTADPLGMFRILSRTQVADYADIAIKGCIRFAETVFGKAYIAFSDLVALVDGDGSVTPCNWISTAADYASSPYARKTRFKENELPSMRGKHLPSELLGAGLDGIWKSDRTLVASDAIEDLSTVSRSFESFMALVDGSDAEACDRAISELAQFAYGSFDGISLKAEIGAMQALKSLFAMKDGMEIDLTRPSRFAELLSVQLSDIEHADADASTMIQILPLARASMLGSSTFDEVVICDVSDEAFNSKRVTSALDRLAERLGLVIGGSRAEEVRQTFFQAVSAATNRLVCMLPRHGYDGSEAFPSFCFDELLELRFEGTIKATDLGKDPEGIDFGEASAWSAASAERFLATSVANAGEENLQAGIGKRVTPPESVEVLSAVTRGRLSRLALPDRMRRANGKIVLSASSIEEYLKCPYMWFIDKVLRPREYGEGFGPLERGSFAHRVLQRFFERLKSSGASSLIGLDDSALRQSLNQVFDAELSEQPSLPPGSGRYIPLTRLERIEAEDLKRSIGDAVILERLLPSRYEPSAFEKRIDPTDLRSSYAGFAIAGMVDRIDRMVDGSDKLSYFILDYKGSIVGHECGDPKFERIEQPGGAVAFDPGVLPEFVQTLVYAQVMRRLFDGAPCVGALYTSYKAKSGTRLVIGAYSTSVPGFDAISDKGSQVEGSFDTFLDMVEGALAVRLSGIESSQIDVEPEVGDPCRFCKMAGGRCR